MAPSVEILIPVSLAALVACAHASGEIRPREPRPLVDVDSASAVCTSTGAPTVMLREPLRFCNITGLLSCCTEEMDAALQNTFERHAALVKKKRGDINTLKKFLCKTSKPQKPAAAYHRVILISVTAIAVSGVSFAAMFICFKVVKMMMTTQQEEDHPTSLAITCGNNNSCFCCDWGERGGLSGSVRAGEVEVV